MKSPENKATWRQKKKYNWKLLTFGTIYITGNTAHALHNLVLYCVHVVVAVALIVCFYSFVSFVCLLFCFSFVFLLFTPFVCRGYCNLPWNPSQLKTDKPEIKIDFSIELYWLPLRIVNTLNRHSRVLLSKSKNS